MKWQLVKRVLSILTYSNSGLFLASLLNCSFKEGFVNQPRALLRQFLSKCIERRAFGSLKESAELNMFKSKLCVVGKHYR